MSAKPGSAVPARGSAFATLLLLLSATAVLADYADGRKAYDSGDYAGAMQEWKPLAERGDASAQYGLGLLFETGKGLPQADPGTAVEWYEKSAAQGMSTAQSNLGLMYAEGRGVPRDVLRAVELWRQAAAAGQPSAQFNLGLTYYRGDGVPRDYAEAANWFAAAALNDVADAQFALAEMYRIGRGVMQNQDTARGWYVKAAANGNEAATRRLKLYASEEPETAPESVVRLSPPEKPKSELPTVAEELVSAAPSVQDAASTPPAAVAAESAESQASADTTAPLSDAAATGSVSAGSPPAVGDAPIAVSGSEATAAASDVANQAALEAGAVPGASTDESGEGSEYEEIAAAAVSPSEGEEPDAHGAIRMATPVAQPAPEPGVNRIWLTSLASAELADQSWRSLVERYPDLLSGLDLAIRKVDLGVDKGIWYRVMVGPFENRQAAKAVCVEILRRAPEENCMAVVN